MCVSGAKKCTRNPALAALLTWRCVPVLLSYRTRVYVAGRQSRKKRKILEEIRNFFFLYKKRGDRNSRAADFATLFEPSFLENRYQGGVSFFFSLFNLGTEVPPGQAAIIIFFPSITKIKPPSFSSLIIFFLLFPRMWFFSYFFSPKENLKKEPEALWKKWSVWYKKKKKKDASFSALKPASDGYHHDGGGDDDNNYYTSAIISGKWIKEKCLFSYPGSLGTSVVLSPCCDCEWASMLSIFFHKLWISKNQ
jgi:hypothetical protein